MPAIDPTQVIVAVIAAYAAIQSRKAERNSRPVSNGFTYHVREQLRQLREDVRELRKEVKDDWQDHYNNHH